MRHIKEVLRLRFHAGLSIRQIRSSTGLSVGAIQKLLKEAERLKIAVWPLPPQLDDAELERRLYPSSTPARSRRFEQPDWPAAHQELKRNGMTKQLLELSDVLFSPILMFRQRAIVINASKGQVSNAIHHRYSVEF